MFGRFRRGRGETSLPSPVWATPHGPPPPPGAWRAALAAIPDGTPIGDALERALADEMAARAGTVIAGWPAPRLSGLRIRRAGVPDAWTGGGTIFLAAGDAMPELAASPNDPPSGGLAAIGAGSSIREIVLGGSNALVAIGDGSTLPYVNIQTSDATVLVGERTGATLFLQIDARNGGAVLIGDDVLLASGTRMITDDMHAIRDRATGRRLNLRGGRIAIGRHVWIGEQVMIGGETIIGEDCVLGAQSMTKGRVLPAHSVCFGRPARVTRTGTTWTHEDEP